MQSAKRADDLEFRMFGRLSEREKARVERLAVEAAKRRAICKSVAPRSGNGATEVLPK
ncbi:MAG: hypothetical protein WB663_02355 [Beijerinckiaceae bacterium]